MLVAALPEEERNVRVIARELGTSTPTTYHLLNTLVDAKLLTRDDQKRYQLGTHIGVLAAAYERQRVVPSELVVPLQRLSVATGEGAYLSVWRDGSIEIAAHLNGTHAVQVANLQPGFHNAAHARASGKVLLAFAEPAIRERYLGTHALEPLTPKTITDLPRLEHELNRVRRLGYATEEQEFALGVACIAVPVFDHDYLVGAYTISSPYDRYKSAKARYLGALRQAAAEVRNDSAASS
jgi:DNA-binding IclR family transcriptional regulator